MKCKICQSPCTGYAAIKVRQEFDSQLWSCDACGFIFMDPVTWLGEAYKTPIEMMDVGYVSRNLASRDFLSQLLGLEDPASNYYCDYGGGCGLLVRLMRDVGFRFHWYDLYCENLFARGMEADPAQFAPYSALTAIEVFEHMPEPVENVREMLRLSSRIIFTTDLQPQPRPLPEEWSYIGLPHGQHISFYNAQSLKLLAAKFGLTYKSLGACWHEFAPEVSGNQKARPGRTGFWHRKPVLPIRPSLLAVDFEVLKKHAGEKAGADVKKFNVDAITHQPMHTNNDSMCHFGGTGGCGFWGGFSL